MLKTTARRKASSFLPIYQHLSRRCAWSTRLKENHYWLEKEKEKREGKWWQTNQAHLPCQSSLQNQPFMQSSSLELPSSSLSLPASFKTPFSVTDMPEVSPQSGHSHIQKIQSKPKPKETIKPTSPQAVTYQVFWGLVCWFFYLFCFFFSAIIILHIYISSTFHISELFFIVRTSKHLVHFGYHNYIINWFKDDHS